jgi:hypothetical protein
VIFDKPKAIQQGYEDVVRALPGKFQEQKHFLMTHPNLPIWKKNMLKEIFTAEMNPRLKLGPDHIRELIKAGAQIAVQCFINAKIKDLMTPAELRRHQEKADEMKDTQSMLDDMAKEAMSTATTKGMYTGGNSSQKKATKAETS